MKIQKKVKFLNLMYILSELESFLAHVGAFRVEQVLYGISTSHPEGYLFHQLHFVFVSFVYLFLASFSFLISTPACMTYTRTLTEEYSSQIYIYV